MEFVVPLMLVGLAGIAVPILIHLFNHRTARTVDWGAFQFLRDSLMKRRRRLLLEETLLLVCRCLVVSLAALALARPFIRAQSHVPWAVVLPLVFVAITAFGAAFAMWPYKHWRHGLLGITLIATLLIGGTVALERRFGLGSLSRGAARDVAIIVDCSASMAMTRDGVSNHARILKEIEADIRTVGRDIAFGIIKGGPLPHRLTPAPLTDRRPLYEHLQSIRPATGTMDVPAALTAAAALLAEGDNRVKQIIIYGDGQAAGWDASNETRWNVVKAVFAQLPDPPSIIWRTLELPQSLRNLAVADITPMRDIVGTDRETTIQVTLKNTGKESVTPGLLTLNVEGKPLVNRAIGQILPGSTRVVEFRHHFARAGAEILTATVDAQDDIALDDTTKRVVQIVGTLDVLLVEANPNAQLAKQATGFLRAALRPELQKMTAEAAPERSTFLVAPKVESAAVVARRTSFQDCAVIVLADVPQLPKDVADRIAEFVSSGGGLLITPGSKTVPEFYNGWTWRGESVAPLPLKGFATERRTRRRPSLDPETFSGRTVRNLQTQNDLKRAIVAGWWQMDATEQPQRVEGAMTTGDPFLAVRRLGRGTVAMTAFPLDASLSSIPSLQSFLPLVHEMIYALANPTTTELNLDPSPSPVLMLSWGGFLVGSGRALDPSGNYSRELDSGSLTQPTEVYQEGASTNAIPAQFVHNADGLSLHVKANLEPGVYKATIIESLTDLLKPYCNPEGTIPFVVRAGIAESDLRPAPPESLTFLRRFIELDVATKPDEIATALRGKRFGREIWRSLASAALLFLLLELLLSRWIAIQRRTGQEETIKFEKAGGAPEPFQKQLEILRKRGKGTETK